MAKYKITVTDLEAKDIVAPKSFYCDSYAAITEDENDGVTVVDGFSMIDLAVRIAGDSTLSQAAIIAIGMMAAKRVSEKNDPTVAAIIRAFSNDD